MKRGKGLGQLLLRLLQPLPSLIPFYLCLLQQLSLTALFYFRDSSSSSRSSSSSKGDGRDFSFAALFLLPDVVLGKQTDAEYQQQQQQQQQKHLMLLLLLLLLLLLWRSFGCLYFMCLFLSLSPSILHLESLWCLSHVFLLSSITGSKDLSLLQDPLGNRRLHFRCLFLSLVLLGVFLCSNAIYFKTSRLTFRCSFQWLLHASLLAFKFACSPFILGAWGPPLGAPSTNPLPDRFSHLFAIKPTGYPASQKP